MTTTSHNNELAVVVGATGEFGSAIVKRLVGHGLTVMAVARSAESLAALKARYPGRVLTCAADLASNSAVATIAAALDRPVRMAVHGPGVPVAGDILKAPTDKLMEGVNIKVGGMLRLVRAVDAKLVEGARLVAIGGHFGLEPTAAAAAAGIANSSLFACVRQLSLAYGPRGITAHTISPGPADTERLRKMAVQKAAANGTTEDAEMDAFRKESSLGRFTTPEQVAWAVTTLLAPEADAMTGSIMMLDSGRRHGLP